jgi:hypothetical protein
MSTGSYSVIFYARKLSLVRYIIEGTAEVSFLITILGTIELFLIAYSGLTSYLQKL